MIHQIQSDELSNNVAIMTTMNYLQLLPIEPQMVLSICKIKTSFLTEFIHYYPKVGNQKVQHCAVTPGKQACINLSLSVTRIYTLDHPLFFSFWLFINKKCFIDEKT